VKECINIPIKMCHVVKNIN